MTEGLLRPTLTLQEPRQTHKLIMTGLSLRLHKHPSELVRKQHEQIVTPNSAQKLYSFGFLKDKNIYWLTS